MNLDDIHPIKHGSRIEYLVEDLAVRFSNLYPESDSLKAWVEVRWQGNVPSPKLLTFGLYNLRGPRTVSALVAGCRFRGGPSDEELKEVLSAIIFDLISDFDEGDPPVSLKGVELGQSDHRWVLKPLVGSTGATSLIGPGGSLKSYVALAAGCTVASGSSRYLGLNPRVTATVLYLDWEADAATHAERMHALCAPYDLRPPDALLYRPERSPLHRSVTHLERICSEYEVGLLIVDSVMLARGGDAHGADDTIRFYGALRQIGIPALLVDHKSREAQRKGWAGAYGSVVNDNSARLQWEVAAVEENGVDDIAILLKQEKRNNVGRMAPLAFEIHFQNGPLAVEAVQIDQIDPSTVEAFAERGKTTSDQVVAELRRAGVDGITVKELAIACGKSVNTIRARLSSLAKYGQVESDEAVEGTAKRWWFVDQDGESRRQNPDPF